MKVVDLDHQRFFLEPVAPAAVAGAAVLVLAQLLPHPVAVGLAVSPIHVVDQPLEGPRGAVGPGAVVVDHGYGLVARPVEQDFAVALPQFVEGRIQIKAEMGADRVQRLHVVLRRAVGPGRQRAFAQAQPAHRHHQIRVKEQLVTQPIARRTGAEGVVEREQPGLDLVDGKAADRTGKLGGKGRPLLGLGILDDRQPVGQLERGLKAVGQPLFHAFLEHHPVDHDLDGVLELLVQRRGFFDQVHDIVDLDPLEATLLQLGELLAVLALTPAHDRRKQVKPGPFALLDGPVDHLADGLTFDRQACCRRVGDADPGVEQAQVIVDFRHRAHGRARVLGRGFLLDGNRRGQPLDAVHIGLFHHFEELPGVGRKALDVAALTLRINSIESQRGFAGPRQPGDHHQLVSRQVDVDPTQVMLARPAHGNIGAFVGGEAGLLRRHREADRVQVQLNRPKRLRLFRSSARPRGRISGVNHTH